MKLVRYTGSDDWSALYIDGRLDTVGDHYLIDERIAEISQVEVRDSDNFLMGGNSKNATASTLDDIEYYEVRQKERAVRQVSDLRQTAADLLRQAEELENAYLQP